MDGQVEKFKSLISDFLKIPHHNTEPTFLEICKYPQSRFEEVCSRILAFYLNPKAEHGMYDLWIFALLETVDKSDWYDYRHNIKINTEEYAYGKRIDITIVSEDYVIAIENKITAALYNPLNIYKKYISKTYPKKKQLLLVLSLKPIPDKHLMTANDFQRCSYQDLFNKIHSHIGNYMFDANQKYLTYLVDFMKTIKNMNNPNSQLEKKFFSDNKTAIDELIKRYNQYKAVILQEQIDKIAALKETMKNLTGGKWWAWQGWDLGVTFNEKSNRIGIEAHFEENEGNPVAVFHACITTWSKTEWLPYNEIVLNEFADYHPTEDLSTGNRVYVWVYKWEYEKNNGNMELIVHALTDIYNRLSKIASSIH